MSKQKPFEILADGPGTLKSAELSCFLDRPTTLTIKKTLTVKQRAEFSLSSISKVAGLKCNGKQLFQADLFAVRCNDLHEVELEYRDSLEILSRVFESEFLKDQHLEDFLKKIASLVGLRPRFFGKFGLKMPGMDLGGKSYLEHLQSISEDFGFYFLVHSVSKEMHFIRLGSHRESGPFEGAYLGSISSARTSGFMYDSAEVFSIDSNEGRARKTELSRSALYSPLGFLKNASSFEAKKNRMLAGGRMETVCPGATSPEQMEQILANRLSKRAAGSEIFRFFTAHLPGLPGDCLELKSAPEKSLHGKYLIAGCRTSVRSSMPLHELTLIRA